MHPFYPPPTLLRNPLAADCLQHPFSSTAAATPSVQVVRYQQGQKYEGHHDFFDVCDLSDKATSGRRQARANS